MNITDRLFELPASTVHYARDQGDTSIITCEFRVAV